MPSNDPRTIAKEARTVAVVGASDDPSKYSNEVASYLKEHGKHIIPVNPHDNEVLGDPTVSRVDEIQEQVDVVDVFLHSEQTPEVAEYGGAADSRRGRSNLHREQMHAQDARGATVRLAL
jgi:predicted CoA-binding protein